MNEAPILVAVRDLERKFDVSGSLLARIITRSPRQYLKAVNGLSFDISKGETFALVGESGSGKSTVARMVAGLMQPSGGSVTVAGFHPGLRRGQGSARELQRIQMIFQDPYASLNARWRASNIIAEPIRAFGTTKGERAIQDRIDELLELVGLHPEDGRKFPHEFSGGQRQRIAIARALASNPEFIICDEPTSALDVSVQAQILNLMRELQEKLGLTYLFISHNLAVVRYMASRIGVMYLGRIVETAEGRTLFAEPRHPYTQLLIQAVPSLEASGSTRQEIKGEIPNPISPPSGCTFHPRCPFVSDICRRENPPMVDGVACHAVNGRSDRF